MTPSTRQLTPREIHLLRASHERVAADAASMACSFYSRLLEIAPHLKTAFTGDRQAADEPLARIMAAAAQDLDQMDRLQPMLENVGRRQARRGLAPADYAALGEALVWALARTLGADFTPDTKIARTKAYTLLSATMIRAGAAAATA